MRPIERAALSHATNERAEAARLRFSERESRLILAAVYAKYKADRGDLEWRDLFRRLHAAWGDGGVDWADL